VKPRSNRNYQGLGKKDFGDEAFTFNSRPNRIEMPPGAHAVIVRFGLDEGTDMVYQIRIAGVLDQNWADWLGCLQIASESQSDGSIVTTLTVDVADQSALFGILDHIHDLNLTLITVTGAEE
jgi:hypothetical protein